MLKATVASSWAYRMNAASGLVAPAGMTGAAPGLGGGTTGVTERVAYTVGERVRDRCSRVLHPRLVQTGATFELRSSCRGYMVVYVGSPSIYGIVGFLKLLKILSTEMNVMQRR